MKFVYLGRTGLKVSELCLGAMTLGRETNENTSRTMMDHFVKVGDNFFDTANVYSNGASEEILGRWQKGHGERENLVLATKIHFPMGKGPNDGFREGRKKGQAELARV
jgi:aryl-alcohol dehydrogenase-like predicted oxidoreductase